MRTSVRKMNAVNADLKHAVGSHVERPLEAGGRVGTGGGRYTAVVGGRVSEHILLVPLEREAYLSRPKLVEAPSLEGAFRGKEENSI